MIDKHQVEAMAVAANATVYGTGVDYGRPVLQKIGSYEQVHAWFSQMACLLMGSALYTLNCPSMRILREEAQRVGAWHVETLRITSAAELFELASTSPSEKAADIGYILGRGQLPPYVATASGMKHIRTAVQRYGALLHRYHYGEPIVCRDAVTVTLIRRTEAAIKMAHTLGFSPYKEEELQYFLDVIGSRSNLQLIFGIESNS